jgi:hypothetical protein
MRTIPDPPSLNVGSADEPRLILKAEAWQHAYAMNVLVDCDGDDARLLAAGQHCRDDMTGKAHPAKRLRELSRAADLCEQAARMVEDAVVSMTTRRVDVWLPPASTRLR